MFHKQLFNTKITVEKTEDILSDDNRWIAEHTEWQKMWASVSLKDISAKRAIYLFAVRARSDFPKKFRIKINDKVFIPTQSAIKDPVNDVILFHAVLMQ